MVIANPREPGLWTPRTQEFTGGYNGREMLGDYDVNPNEDSDGLSHHTKQSPEDRESGEQTNPRERRKKALAELVPAIPHVKMKPADIDEEISRQPMREGASTLLESGLGVDMGLAARGISQAAGANVGPIRSDTANVRFGRHTGLMPGSIGKSISIPFSDTNVLQKARRKYKGRKYEEDEESDEEEKRSKKKSKRERKRKGKGKRPSRGGREPKSQTKRSAAAKARQLDRHSKRQAFNPNQRSLPLRMLGATRAEGIPLRLRDPVAWERKKAYERERRARGALPKGMTAHHDPRGFGTRGHTIGGSKTRGTKLPASPKLGTSTNPTTSSAARRDRISPDGVGDPLGTSDPLAKSKSGLESLSRADIMSLKRKVENLLNLLNKVKKAPPELEWEAKRGNQASDSLGTSPTGPTEVNTEEQAIYRFDDTSLAMNVVGKR